MPTQTDSEMGKQQIREFLTRVANEPAYRARLENDPVGTLAELGINIRDSDVPPEGVQLPSKDEILDNLEKLVERLWPSLCLQVLRLEI